MLSVNSNASRLARMPGDEPSAGRPERRPLLLEADMLDKAIMHGKERRKPYYQSGRFDRTCRPHGGCPWCLDDRLHAANQRRMAAEYQMAEYLHRDVK